MARLRLERSCGQHLRFDIALGQEELIAQDYLLSSYLVQARPVAPAVLVHRPLGQEAACRLAGKAGHYRKHQAVAQRALQEGSPGNPIGSTRYLEVCAVHSRPWSRVPDAPAPCEHS